MRGNTYKQLSHKFPHHRSYLWASDRTHLNLSVVLLLLADILWVYELNCVVQLVPDNLEWDWDKWDMLAAVYRMRLRHNNKLDMLVAVYRMSLDQPFYNRKCTEPHKLSFSNPCFADLCSVFVTIFYPGVQKHCHMTSVYKMYKCNFILRNSFATQQSL